MKKHVFGFALFSFIVGTTIFLYALLNIGSVAEIHAPAYSPTYSRPTSCWRMKRELRSANLDLPTVKQAIFDSKSKQLKWELSAPDADTPVALNFFIKDEKGTRYVNSMFVPTNTYRVGSIVRSTSSYEWLDNLDSYENLYVVAEPILYGEYGYTINSHDFDASKATPVLVY